MTGCAGGDKGRAVKNSRKWLARQLRDNQPRVLSRFRGMCGLCEGDIRAEEPIVMTFMDARGGKAWVHESCARRVLAHTGAPLE